MDILWVAVLVISRNFMNNFNFGNRSRGNKDSFRRNSGGRDSRRPSMHDAVCDECGRDCQVPFRPSGDKPIYCSECFEKRSGGDSGRSKRDFGDRGPGRSAQGGAGDRDISQLRKDIEVLNTKLDTVISLLSSAGQKKSGLVVDRTKTSKKSKVKPRVKPKVEKKLKKSSTKA